MKMRRALSVADCRSDGGSSPAVATTATRQMQAGSRNPDSLLREKKDVTIT
jgi:hypothetical protein